MLIGIASLSLLRLAIVGAVACLLYRLTTKYQYLEYRVGFLLLL